MMTPDETAGNAPGSGGEAVVIGLVVNPIAGMGGRVGLKGTDGVLEEALARGAAPAAPSRAASALRSLYDLMARTPDAPSGTTAGGPRWLTCGGDMGEASFQEAGIERGDFAVVYSPSAGRTGAGDTKAACARFIEEGADLVVFCGGDGTARDVLDAVGRSAPVLGIPAGVKMHSGVFAVDPSSAAEVMGDFIAGRLTTAEVDVLDLDEDRYRRGEWNIRLYGSLLTPYEPTMVQSGKATFHGASEDEVLEEIAEGLVEDMDDDPGSLYILGAGGTLAVVGEELGVDFTLLGVDAVAGRKMVGKDLDEGGILELLDRHPRAYIVVSPIGAQGFILGRGNLQLSPRVVERVGLGNIIVLATPAKLAKTPALRVDTGDPDLDARFREKGHLFVTISYRTKRLVPVR